MERIYSKVKPDLLLHIIHRYADVKNRLTNRVEIVPPNEFIQCASLKLPSQTTFRPHKHIVKERHYSEQIAQESWVIMRGSVRCYLYDIDDTLLVNRILKFGDCSFTLQGGHTYKILDPETIVYEYKTGPYEGQELDKTFIDGK